MIMTEIKKIAQKHGIKTSKLNKTALIRTIQKTEGNFDCFASATSEQCDQPNCIWQADCFKIAKANKS